MSLTVGIPILNDIDKARRLPISNLPEGTKRIRIRKERNLVRFYIKLKDGIQIYLGTEKNGGIQLIKLAGKEAYTRKP